MRRETTILLAAAAAASVSVSASGQRYAGGDISMLPMYEERGAVYYDSLGETIAPLSFFQEQGMNAMRIRLFVNPENAPEEDIAEGVVQDLDYVIALGRRVKEAGLLLMLDFHYSDTWTDPGQHAVPSAWSGMSVSDMALTVYSYTKDCLEKMTAAGAAPDIIQPGNEVTYGMLWPTGHCYPAGDAPDGGSWDSFAAYLNGGIKASREVCPEAKIAIHIEMHDTALILPFFTQCDAHDIDYDIIALSYYPEWHGPLSALDGALTALETKFPEKKIMIAETGFAAYSWGLGGAVYTSLYPNSQEGQTAFTDQLIDTLLGHERVSGLFWWWPEDNEYGIDWRSKVTTDWWAASLFNSNTGQCFKAIYKMKRFVGGEESVSETTSETERKPKVYNLCGQRVWSPVKGIYITGGGKRVIR